MTTLLYLLACALILAFILAVLLFGGLLWAASLLRCKVCGGFHDGGECVDGSAQQQQEGN